MMENGFTDDQPLRSKSNKKKKRKRDRENKPEDQPDSQETGGSEGVEVNNEEASTENTDENMENGVPDDQPPRSKSKKKKKKRERENDLDYQLDSQETLESENIEENGLLVEGTPKKKRKKEHENKTERQPSTEENPESVSVKGKVKKPNKKGPRTFKQIYPDEILKLEEQFLKEHNDERFANNAAKFLTPEDREIMKNNWISFFKDHPHPDPRELIRMKHKYDEKTRAEMDTFIAEHNFYKRLVQGIEDNPVRILRTAIRSFPYRSKPQREKMEEVFGAHPPVPPLRENEPPTLQQVLRTSGDTPLWELLQRTYTEVECTWIYHATLKQVKCNMWHKHRVGRITASRMHCIYNFMSSGCAVLSASLIKDTLRHMSPRECGKTWGEVKESVAVAAYVKHMSPLHRDLKVLPCGLWVNSAWPHLGASSDGYVTCACCPPRLLEIKCPQSLQQSTPEHASFVEKSHDGGFTLQQPHKYHTQALAQMALMETPRLDFIVWTPKNLIIIPVTLDADMWDGIKEACDGFFERHVVGLLRMETNCRSKQRKVSSRRKTLRRRR